MKLKHKSNRNVKRTGKVTTTTATTTTKRIISKLFERNFAFIERII